MLARLSIALGLALSAPAAGATPLIDAFFRADAVDIHRAGRAAGARGLAPDLASPDRPTLFAAMRAAPAAEDAWALLFVLGARAAEADRSVAAPAAATASEIAAALDQDELLYQEVPSDYLVETFWAWERLARDPERFVDIRVRALEVLKALVAAAPKGALPRPFRVDWGSFFADDDPELRIAALELVPQPLPEALAAEAAALVAADPSASAALAAGQAVCGALEAARAPLPSTLGQAGIARLRKLVLDRRLPPAARFDAARCLVADGSPESRRALRQLRTRLPGYLRPSVQRWLKARR